MFKAKDAIFCKDDGGVPNLTKGNWYTVDHVDPEGFACLMNDAGTMACYYDHRFVLAPNTANTALSADLQKAGNDFPTPTPFIDLLKAKGDQVYTLAPTRGPLVAAFDPCDEAPRARGSDLQPQTPDGVRAFGTGATRDLDANKLDFEGFLSPLVLERYAEHMHKARRMPDGSMRESDNWQLGIPIVVYMKSLWRHFFSVWKLHRGLKVTEVVKGETVVKDLETELCAMLFNTSGMLHEVLKAKSGL